MSRFFPPALATDFLRPRNRRVENTSCAIPRWKGINASRERARRRRSRVCTRGSIPNPLLWIVAPRDGLCAVPQGTRAVRRRWVGENPSISKKSERRARGVRGRARLGPARRDGEYRQRRRRQRLPIIAHLRTGARRSPLPASSPRSLSQRPATFVRVPPGHQSKKLMSSRPPSEPGGPG